MITMGNNNKSYRWLPIAFFNKSCKEETRAAYDLALRINLLIIFSINWFVFVWSPQPKDIQFAVNMNKHDSNRWPASETQWKIRPSV